MAGGFSFARVQVSRVLGLWYEPRQTYPMLGASWTLPLAVS